MPIVTALVEAGANVNYMTPHTKLTALHWAVLNNDETVVKYLIQKGAEMQFSIQLQTPLDVAGLCKYTEVR